MDRYPAAYLRRSTADEDNPGDVSREVQEQAVRGLAERDGHNGNLRVFTDWGRSADEDKEAQRVEFTSMIAAIERGEVSAVYAYALDRLYRSMRTFVRLTDAAKRHNCRIVTLREGILGGDGSPMARAFAQITAAFTEMELNTAKARARSVRDARQARGDVLGQPAYGTRHVKVDGRMTVVPDVERPVEPVLDAYRKAGSVLGATRLLNASGLASPWADHAHSSPRKKPEWHTSTVARILEANAIGLLPRKTNTGRRTPTHDALSQLVACPFCGTRMTMNRPRRQLYCYKGAANRATHPRSVAPERALMAFAEEEAARLIVPDIDVVLAGVETQRDALTQRRARIADNYESGLIDRERRDSKLAAIAREMDDIEVQSTVVELPPSIDWHAGVQHPVELNQVLRTIWSEIRLTPEMRPLDAVWRRPEWRRS
jgi:DNA invertase Pin-like site-specific DNA recombinase